MPIDVTKALTPEQEAQLNAIAEKYTQPPVSDAAKNAVANTGIEISTAAGLPTDIEAAPAVTADDPKLQLDTTAKLPTGKLDANTLRINALERAYNAKEEAAKNRYQEMLAERRKALEKERTDNIRLASFNALGNALRTMVQPVGWAAGGATAGVQPYDNRQYLEAFSRAVKANDELQNLGKEDMAYQLSYENRDAERAYKDFEYQKRRDETNEDYFKRLDAQQKIRAGENYAVLIEKRREGAVKAFYQENARRISHKQPVISFTDFINLDGLGNEYYGNWTPSAAEVKAVESGMAAAEGDAQAPVDTKVTKDTQVTDTTKVNPPTWAKLTDTQKAAISQWSKFDPNNDGEIDKNEVKVAKSNGIKIPKEALKAYHDAWVAKNPNGVQQAAKAAPQNPMQEQMMEIIKGASRTGQTPPGFNGR